MSYIVVFGKGTSSNQISYIP